MFNKKARTISSTESRLTPYCDQIIIAILLVIIIAVPLYFDVHLHSVFDLSKITILYLLTFTVLAIWSIKTMITCEQETKGRETIDERRVYHPSSIVPHPSSIVSRLLSQPLSLPIVSFLFVSGLSTIFSINPYLSLVGTYKRYGGFISTIVYVSLFFIIINFIEKRRLNSLLNVIILTACIASIYGILQHFGLDLYHWSTSFGYGIRVSATFGHPAFFSAFLIMVIPLILIKIFSNPNFRYSAFIYIGILTLLIVTFYYTKTRSSFLGLIISNLFFFSLIGKKNLLANKTKTIVTITILVGISIFFNINSKTSVIGRFIGDIKPALLDSEQHELSSRLSLRQNYSDGDIGFTRQLEGTMFMRVFQYLTGLKIIYDYPILGIGPDTLGMIYPQYLSKVYRKIDEHRSFENQNRIHSDFLDITVSRGLLGLGIYIWFIFAYARMVCKGYKKANGTDKILILGLCTSCLAYFIQNQFSFGHVPIITLFWFLIGMSVIACPHSLLACASKLAVGVRNPSMGLSSHQTNPPERPSERLGRAGSMAGGQILTKWFNNPTLALNQSGSGLERMIKTITCVFIVCLMVSLITLSLFRYKADIYFEYGRRLLKNYSIIEAIQSYEMAVKHNPLALNYRNVLNGIYLKMAITGASKNYENITDENLSSLFTQKQTAMWFTNAITGAEKVQKLYPRDYHSALTLGQAYHLLDKISPARLRTPVPDRTGHSGGDEHELSSALDVSKDAIKYYKRAITLHPFKFEFRDKLAQLYAEKGQFEDAIYELKEAKSIKPTNHASYLNLANVFIKDDERYEDAEAVLLEFIKKKS